jgi:putative glycosyltransferase
LFFAAPISGWTSLMISIYMLGGMVLASLGALGIYIAKIFDEVKDRPYTVVRKVYEKKKD